MSNFEKIVIKDDEYDDFLKHEQKKNPNAPDFETNPWALQSYAKAKYGGKYSFKQILLPNQ